MSCVELITVNAGTRSVTIALLYMPTLQLECQLLLKVGKNVKEGETISNEMPAYKLQESSKGSLSITNHKIWENHPSAYSGSSYIINLCRKSH